MKANKHLYILVYLLCSILPLMGQRKIIQHEIQSGESIYAIAKNYGVSVDEVYDLNPWSKEGYRVGDKLLINARSNASSKASSSRVTYIISSGDTLYSVSRRFGVTEEQLKAANPGVSAERFPVGRSINIPTGDKAASPIREQVSQTSSASKLLERKNKDQAAVKVALALPFSDSNRYVEFYKGFLMGVNELKRSGISVDILVENISDTELLRAGLALGQYSGRDLVFGGANEEEVKLLSVGDARGYTIVPFNGSEQITNISDRVIQINAPGREVISLAISQFLRDYQGRNVVFISRKGDEWSNFAQELKGALLKAQLPMSEATIVEGKISRYGSEVVLVPVNKDKELLTALIGSLDEEDACQLFGYSAWQSYPEFLQQALHRYNATIYTSFYFDSNSAEALIFLNQYKAFYGQPLPVTYPRYAVLGYDLARYFIRAWRMGGVDFMNIRHTLPSDGLQMDLSIAQSINGISWVNKGIYFVHFTKDGSVSKKVVR